MDVPIYNSCGRVVAVVIAYDAQFSKSSLKNPDNSCDLRTMARKMAMALRQPNYTAKIQNPEWIKKS